jgi:hypothetical protein
MAGYLPSERQRLCSVRSMPLDLGSFPLTPEPPPMPPPIIRFRLEIVPGSHREGEGSTIEYDSDSDATVIKGIARGAELTLAARIVEAIRKHLSDEKGRELNRRTSPSLDLDPARRGPHREHA